MTPGPRPFPGLPIPRRYEFSFLDSRQETPASMTFRFSTEGTEFQFLSNQAIRLVLPRVDDPYGPARSFSLSSSPSERGLIAVTAKMTGSPYKEGLKYLRPGERVLVMGPLGDLLFNPDRPAVFIAGGIGVTPFRGMLRFAADTGATQPIRLLYSARVPEEFAFREELDALVKAHPQFRVHYTVTRPQESQERWRGRTGRIDIPWIRKVSGELRRPKFYVVGLPEMASETVQRLKSEMGIPEEDLEYEYFGGY
ncbi:MAG: oxidoreductase [Thermoplasmata archaeon]|nr:oxidoreductase [Thermoplasmata archaeon]